MLKNILEFIFYDHYQNKAEERIKNLGNVIGHDVLIIKIILEKEGHKVHVYYTDNYYTTYEYCIHIKCDNNNIILSTPYYQ